MINENKIMQDQLIQLLKSNKAYLSGEEISRRFKISRAGIWKNIEELRKNGYAIEAVPNLGYSLKSVPDKLFPREIQSGLKTKIFGQNIIHFETTETTMRPAFERGLNDEGEGVLIVAETQTKGKGRMGRSWVSPKSKGIYASLLLRPQFHPTDVAKLTLMAAIAIAEAVQKVTGVLTKIKWPNDVLVEGKKLAGILTEMDAEMERVKFVVVGFGINVNTPESALPDGSTSLKQLTGKNISRIQLLQEILWALEMWYLNIKKNGFNAGLKRWKELTSTLGSKVKIVESGQSIIGMAEDIDDYGGLLIRLDSGKLIRRMSGDVVEIGKR